MSIFIQETGRSFPNVDDGGEYKKTWQRPSNGDYESHAHHSGPGTNYRITFNEDGPGSTAFGTDKVFYIGDNDPACLDTESGADLDSCDYNRQPIFRWYRGGKDHKYTSRNTLRWPTDFTGEQAGPDNTQVSKKYNPEPRNGTPVFFLARTPKTGKTKALHHWYENDKNDTQLVANNNTYTPGGGGGPGSGYVYIDVLGYVFNTEADAREYADYDEDPVPLYEYYRSSSSDKKDHFYTVDPASEVNLNGGPIEPRDPRDREYDYVGIVGWCFAKDSGGSGTRRVYADQGLIGPIGYGNPVSYATRAGWYDWEEVDLAGHYSRGGSQPAVWVHENYEYQFDADAGTLRTYDADGQALISPTYMRGNRFYGTPSVSKHPDFRWGHPDYCPLNNADALFEWFYGKNGAVKAAVPKYLEFHTAFDSQFLYYIYNTEYPWKGPIFSVQYSISDRNHCPNRRIGTGNRHDDRCVCDEQYVTKEYFSHFYEIRQDKWRTTSTSLTLTNFADGEVEECFKTVDTESHTILFRYISGGLDRYETGDTINGWEIGEYGYFGNELRCGYMELQGQGDVFTAGQQFTPKGRDAARIEILCGYGIGGRAGFFGVYEFPKKLSYYKVEIDKTALVHSKTLDQAELSVSVDTQGRIETVRIENAGFGYKNPKIVIQEPTLLNEYGAMDMTRDTVQQMSYELPNYKSPTNQVENYDGEDYNFNMKRIQKNVNKQIKRDIEQNSVDRKDAAPYSKNSDLKIEGADQDENISELATVSFENKQLQTVSSESRRRENMKPAVLEVARLDPDGLILEVRIKDRGRGYDPDPNNPPKVFVVEVEEEEYTMRGPNTKKGQKAFQETVNDKTNKKRVIKNGGVDENGKPKDITIDKKTLKDIIREMPAPKKGRKLKESELSVLDDGTIGSFDTMMKGFNTKYPTGYIKIGQVDEVEQIALCNSLPGDCVKINMPALAGQALFTVPDVKHIMKASQQFNDMMRDTYDQIQQGADDVDKQTDRISSLYGWNNDQECIVVPQPKFYNVTRFKDLPCPYIDEETGRAFGWIVYKYCASKSDNGHFQVNLEVRGKTTGPDGEKFMDFMHKLPQPSLTPPRPVQFSGSEKDCWKCTRNLGAASANQEIEGRCYWDPSGGDDVVFVPVGLDENTYDWGHLNYTELQQLQVWLGDNIESYRTQTPSYTTATTPGTPATGNPGDPDYDPGTSSIPGVTNTNNFMYCASLKRLDGGMPEEECWDTYVYRSSGNGNPDGVLDVYSAYFKDGSGENQTQGKTPGETFWESRIYDGYAAPVQGYFGGGICWYATSWLYSILYGSSGNGQNEFALEYVNDLSIAINPYLQDQLGLKMGPYTGTMAIKNWSTGSTIAFGNTAKNMGNPFFDECGGGIFDRRDEVVQPNPPVPLRKKHTSSYDPGDKELLKKQKKAGTYDDINDVEFEDDSWKDFYDPDFDFEEETDSKISEFSTDVDNLFNGQKNPEDF